MHRAGTQRAIGRAECVLNIPYLFSFCFCNVKRYRVMRGGLDRARTGAQRLAQAGGKEPDKPGFWLEPTVVTGLQ